MKLISSSLAILALGSILCSAQADSKRDAINPGDKDVRWVVGGTFFSNDNLYEGEGRESRFVPTLRFNGEKLFVRNSSIGYSIHQWNHFSIGVIAGLHGTFLSNEDNFDDNQSLIGLEERDSTIDGGIYFNHTTDMGRLNLTVLTDLGSEHDGQSAGLSYTFDLKAGKWSINPSVAVQWLSNNIVDHHFGVRSSEETITRSAYSGGSALNWQAGIRGRYEISDHWDINLATGITRMDSEISNSSIVEEDTVYHGSVSVRYNF
ncbi:MAG: MipA/OmpV family protein [bacterium]|nr:MipA/OmpV family protein [Gammaproteobacteria bacterium]